MTLDPLTGAYVADTHTDADAFKNAGTSKTHDAKPTPPAEKEEFKEEKVAKLNKKAIIIGIASVVLILMGLRFFKSSRVLKKKRPEKKAATDIIMPEFGDYKNRGYKEDMPPTESVVQTSITESPAEYTLPVSVTQTVKPEKTGSLATRPAGALSNEELQARKSALAAPIRRQNNTKVQSASNQEGMYQSPVEQDNYLATRLNALNDLTQKSSYETQNMQGNKIGFYEKNKTEFTGGYYLSEESVWTGTIIPAVLLTGITTDLPGQIKAQVTENIFDSLTGRMLLIPQGSILIAEYNSSVSYSQKRIQIAWNTLIRPDGYRVNLGNMNGVDNAGFSGIKGWVDDHIFEYIKAMGLISVFTAINGEFDNQMKQLNNQYASNLLQQNQTVINQLGAKLIDRALDVQPTLFLNSGKKVNVFVNKPIMLPALKK